MTRTMFPTSTTWTFTRHHSDNTTTNVTVDANYDRDSAAVTYIVSPPNALPYTRSRRADVSVVRRNGAISSVVVSDRDAPAQLMGIDRTIRGAVQQWASTGIAWAISAGPIRP